MVSKALGQGVVKGGKALRYVGRLGKTKAPPKSTKGATSPQAPPKADASGTGDGIIVVEKKPYSKHRPSYKKGQVDDTWESAKDRNGKVIDPNTGEELAWDKSKPRNGQWDMGHRPNEKYHKLHKKYMNGEIPKEDFLRKYQDPKKYVPESVHGNRGRTHEAK